MDTELRTQLEKLIEKYKITFKDDGSEGLTWSGFPDKRGLANIKVHSDEIAEILKEK